MASDRGTRTSGKQSQARDGRDPCEITKDEMREYIRIAGRPWHHRKKKISLKRVRALMDLGFSVRQVALIYKTSETTIRRRLKGN